MKKTYVQFNKQITSASLSRHDGGEQFALYSGVNSVYGGWLLETSGGLTCLNELEDAGSESLLRAISAIVADPTTPWEDPNEEDEEAIREPLTAWGIA